ncbi:MAG: RhuM family protein, partial [Akkermansiaceae bacterium]
MEPEATVRQFRTVQTEGSREVTREVEQDNLDMVLALGFRVRSPMAVRFRQWAADKLKEYIT